MNNYNHILASNKNLSNYEILKILIMNKQTVLQDILTVDSICGFEGYSKFEQLLGIATTGVQSHIKAEFVPNRGVEDQVRPQYEQFKQQIHHELAKLQQAGKCIMLPRALLVGTEGLHVNVIHVVLKAGADKIRVCTDAAASGLNAGTDMAEVSNTLQEFRMPNCATLAGLLNEAFEIQDNLLYKTDVSGAFNTMKLSPEAALLQTVQVGEWILIPLVSMFGWNATPAYYNVISGAIDWAHNGGIKRDTLNSWAVLQGKKVEISNTVNRKRSMTYVDDSAGAASSLTVKGDMLDIEAIIVKLLGPSAVNVNKTEGPAEHLTIIGWDCNMLTGNMKPSEAALKKMFWWLFRGVSVDEGEFKIKLSVLRKLVGLLRWYSAVIPMASTFAMQGLLTKMERLSLNKLKTSDPLCNIRGEAKAEVLYWRWIMGRGLSDVQVWSAPFWFVAGANRAQVACEMCTDASTSIGGGYYVPLPECIDGSEGHFGQVKWSEDEKLMFGVAEVQDTDINILEFITVVLAILTEKDFLRGLTVRVRVDNTAAISWLNKLRAKHINGQLWVAVLVSTLLDYNITLICDHIANVSNVVANGLSRYIQPIRTQLEDEGFRCMEMPEQEYRLAIWKGSSIDFWQEGASVPTWHM